MADYPVPKGLSLTEGAYTLRVLSVEAGEPTDDGRARWTVKVEYQGHEREVAMSDSLYRRVYDVLQDTDTIEILVTGSGRDTRYAVSG